MTSPAAAVAAGRPDARASAIASPTRATRGEAPLFRVTYPFIGTGPRSAHRPKVRTGRAFGQGGRRRSPVVHPTMLLGPSAVLFSGRLSSRGPGEFANLPGMANSTYTGSVVDRKVVFRHERVGHRRN